MFRVFRVCDCALLSHLAPLLQIWQCRAARKANEVYWQRVQHAQAIPKRTVQSADRKSKAAESWRNPLRPGDRQAPPTAWSLSEEDVEDIELVSTGSQRRWQLSALIGPTLSRAVVSSAASPLAALSSARSVASRLRRLQQAKNKKHMMTHVGRANRNATGPAALSLQDSTAGDVEQQRGVRQEDDSANFVADSSEEGEWTSSTPPEQNNGGADYETADPELQDASSVDVDSPPR